MSRRKLGLHILIPAGVTAQTAEKPHEEEHQLSVFTILFHRKRTPKAKNAKALIVPHDLVKELL